MNHIDGPGNNFQSGATNTGTNDGEVQGRMRGHSFSSVTYRSNQDTPRKELSRSLSSLGWFTGHQTQDSSSFENINISSPTPNILDSNSLKIEFETITKEIIESEEVYNRQIHLLTYILTFWKMSNSLGGTEKAKQEKEKLLDEILRRSVSLKTFSDSFLGVMSTKLKNNKGDGISYIIPLIEIFARTRLRVFRSASKLYSTYLNLSADLKTEIKEELISKQCIAKACATLKAEVRYFKLDHTLIVFDALIAAPFQRIIRYRTFVDKIQEKKIECIVVLPHRMKELFETASRNLAEAIKIMSDETLSISVEDNTTQSTSGTPPSSPQWLSVRKKTMQAGEGGRIRMGSVLLACKEKNVELQQAHKQLVEEMDALFKHASNKNLEENVDVDVMNNNTNASVASLTSSTELQNIIGTSTSSPQWVSVRTKTTQAGAEGRVRVGSRAQEMHNQLMQEMAKRFESTSKSVSTADSTTSPMKEKNTSDTATSSPQWVSAKKLSLKNQVQVSRMTTRTTTELTEI